jgi:hypothetical protein
MFNSAMYYLNFVSPRLSQAIRFVLAHVLPTKELSYDADTAGYSSYVKAPIVGVLAFRKTNGSIQYKW